MAQHAQAQHEADRIRTLQTEISTGEAAEVLALTAEQRTRFDTWSTARLASLEREFDVDLTPTQGSLSWGMRIASALGGLALSVALVLFFQSYWGYFETWVQVVVVMSLPILCLAGAEYAAKRERTLYFAGILSLIALAAFVLNLTVIGQIFNITSSERALLAWGVFATALAYRYGHRLMLAIGLSFLLGYGCCALAATLGYPWQQFWTRPENAVVLALMIWAVPLFFDNPEFNPVYRVTGCIFFFFALFTLVSGSQVSYLPGEPRHIRTFYEVFALSASAGAIWLGIRRRWTGQVNLGAAFFCIFLFNRFCRWWWDWMPAWLFFAIVGLLGVAAVVSLKRLRRLS